MSIEDKLNQTAVYWPPVRVTDTDGMVLGNPEELDCHWEDYQAQMQLSDGRVVMSTARVFFMVPVTYRGFLFFGELADAPADPRTSHTAFEIQKCSGIPSVVDPDNVLYTAWI